MQIKRGGRPFGKMRLLIFSREEFSMGRQCPGRTSWFIAGCLFAAFCLLSKTANGEVPIAWAKAHLGELVELYRHFHTHPELSFEEYETGARLAKELRAAGLEVTDKVAKTGVVGLLKNGSGPTVMIRCDLDALPVTEQTGLAYASRVKVKGDAGETGVMHACGHDIHITNLIATARWFAAHKDQWQAWGSRRKSALAGRR
jgi:hypothetical protein